MRYSFAFIALSALLLSGCGGFAIQDSGLTPEFASGYGGVYAVVGTGLIYTHTREPLMINANATKVSGNNDSSGSVKDLQIQTLRVTWSDNSIGDIARKAGMDTVYYADMETMRILGFWTTQTVHIYGVANGDTMHLEVPSLRGVDPPVQVEGP